VRESKDEDWPDEMDFKIERWTKSYRKREKYFERTIKPKS